MFLNKHGSIFISLVIRSFTDCMPSHCALIVITFIDNLSFISGIPAQYGMMLNWIVGGGACHHSMCHHVLPILTI